MESFRIIHIGRRESFPHRHQKESLKWISYELSDKAAAPGEMGRHDEEIDYCNQALQIDPELTFAWINKGSALSALNRLDEALVCYERACAIEPELAQVW
jgi:tetratricopeptide (TPR) repeat protein